MALNIVLLLVILLLGACLYSAVKHNPHRVTAGLGDMRIVTAAMDPTIIDRSRYGDGAGWFALFINGERVGGVFSAEHMNQEAFKNLTRKQIVQLYHLAIDMVNANQLPLDYAAGAGRMRHCAVGSNWKYTQAVYQYNTMTDEEFEDPSTITLEKVNEVPLEVPA